MEENPIPMKSDLVLMPEHAKRPFHVRAMEIKMRTNKKAKHIAVDCGLAESTVSRYLRGESIPPEDVAQRILQYLQENIVEERIPPQEKIPHVQSNPEETKFVVDTIKSVYEARITDLKERIATAHREKNVLFCAFCVAVVVLVYVLMDAANPSWGAFMPRG